MRWLKVVLVVVPLLLVLGVTVFFWRLDAIVRSTVESQAGTQLNVPATLASADVGVLGGTVGLGDFSLGSPKGFEAPKMFSVDAVDVAVSYGQLTKTPIQVKSIRIAAPKLLVERKDFGINLKALIDGLPPTDPDAETVRMVIGQLKVDGAVVSIRPALPGLPEQIDLQIPPIEVANIGTGEGAENGAAVRDVVLVVLTALAEKAAESEQLPPEVRQILKLDLRQLVEEKARGVGKELEKALDKVGRDPASVGQVGKELEQGLKDTLGIGGGKKKDDKPADGPPPATRPG